jgi:hypothetical protein
MTAAVTVLLSLSGRVYSPVDSSLCISLVLISQDTCAHCQSSKPHPSLLEFSICEYLVVPPVTFITSCALSLFHLLSRVKSDSPV